MQAPPKALRGALVAAAVKWRVPYTVLAAIAFVESTYDAGAVGKRGELGLMQLRPRIVQRYGVTNPLDPAQSAMGAAQFIAALYKACGGDWSTVFAAYNAGPTVANNAWGGPTVQYVKRVWAARTVLQGRSRAGDENPTRSLALAIARLAALNPSDAKCKALAERWVEATKNGISEGPLRRWLLGRSFVNEYADAYDTAPLTDGQTPPPWRIEPDLGVEVDRRVEQIRKEPWFRGRMPKLPSGYDFPWGLVIVGGVAAVVGWKLATTRTPRKAAA
jgi:hypothetical protein